MIRNEAIEFERISPDEEWTTPLTTTSAEDEPPSETTDKSEESSLFPLIQVDDASLQLGLLIDNEELERLDGDIDRFCGDAPLDNWDATEGGGCCVLYGDNDDDVDDEFCGILGGCKLLLLLLWLGGNDDGVDADDEAGDNLIPFDDVFICGWGIDVDGEIRRFCGPFGGWWCGWIWGWGWPMAAKLPILMLDGVKLSGGVK